MKQVSKWDLNKSLSNIPNQGVFPKKYKRRFIKNKYFAIDFGCGFGRNAPFLNKIFKNSLIGIDLDSVTEKFKSSAAKDNYSMYLKVSSDCKKEILGMKNKCVFYESLTFQCMSFRAIKDIVKTIEKNRKIKYIFSYWTFKSREKLRKKFLKYTFPYWDIKYQQTENKTFDQQTHIMTVLKRI